MEESTQVDGTMGNNMALVNILHQRERQEMESGKMVRGLDGLISQVKNEKCIRSPDYF